MAQIQNMMRLCCFVIFLMLAIAEGVPDKPKKVKCQDKAYPDCYHKDHYCPDACLRSCEVDCASCLPVCSLEPEPPPPLPPSLPPPPATVSPPPPPVPTVPHPPPPPATVSPPPPPSVPSVPHPPPSSPLIPSPSPPPSPATVSPPPPPSVPSVPDHPPPTPSAPWIPSPSPPKPSPSPKQVRCKNSTYEYCHRMMQPCPSDCPDHCEVDCVSCKPVCHCNRPGAVCEDPRFVGADGITFYFHGKKDRDFCIVSDSNLHINAHFIGRRNENMKRDFTWVQSLGILFDNHQLFVGAKKTATWDDAIDRLNLSFDGEPIFLMDGEGNNWKLSSSRKAAADGVSITRSRDTNAVVIEVEGKFKIKAEVVPITEKDSLIHNYGITGEDCFAHLDLSIKFYSLSGEVDGVLGQTYASKYKSRVKMGVAMPVLGGEDKFASSTIFSTDCAAARFGGPSIPSDGTFDYTSIKLFQY